MVRIGDYNAMAGADTFGGMHLLLVANHYRYGERRRGPCVPGLTGSCRPPSALLLPCGKVLALALLDLPEIVLFPGDDLSLWILSDSVSPDGTQELLLIGGDLLAVLSPHQTGPQYGVTVQIKRFSVEDQGVRLTGAAKHHFRLRKRLPVEANAELLWGEVEILVSFDELCWQRRAKLEGQSREKHANTTLQRVRGRQFPAYCEHAIYALYDVQVLVQKIQNTLLSNIHGEWFYEPHTERLNGRGDEDECDEKASLVHYLSVPSDEQDPKLFALWVAGNLPLDTTQRRELLRINSTVELLRREIELLEQTQEDIFCVLCSSCSSFLAKTCEIFSVTAHGTAGGTFVNPAGHVFHVLTLRNVDPARVFVDMNRSTEHTWFTGYAWNITHCNSCYQHLGWRFDRVDSTRLPVSFFGFRQAALTGSSGFRQIGS